MEKAKKFRNYNPVFISYMSHGALSEEIKLAIAKVVLKQNYLYSGVVTGGLRVYSDFVKVLAMGTDTIAISLLV